MIDIDMKIERIILLLAMSLSVFMFTSCEDVNIDLEIGNNTDRYREATNYLCSRVWVEEWIDDKDELHRQELRFDYNNTGLDYVRIIDRRGNVHEFSKRFVWDWFNANFSSIRLDYGDGFSYMDNIIMRRNRLKCLFDSYPATFFGE